MEKYVRILRNGNLTDLVSIDVVNGRRNGEDDVASRPARRKYGSHNIDIKSTYVLIAPAAGG